MLKFNRNKVFGFFSTAALSMFLFASSCRAVEPVLLGYITIKAISPKINYGQLNDPLIVKENVFYEIPTASHGTLYMRFVSNDGEFIGPWTEIIDQESLKAPDNKGLYQIQFLIKSDDPGNILNYPNEDFGTFDGSRFSNVFNGLVGDESMDPSGKIIPIVYENNVEVIYNKNESEESDESNESEDSQEFAESNDFSESSESSEFDGSNESDESGNLTLENIKDEESEQPESSEDSSEESKNENVNLGENRPDESKQESHSSEVERSDISGNSNSEQPYSNIDNLTQDSYASPIPSTSDYSTSSQSSSSLKSSSSSSNPKQSSSKSKSSSIKTSEEPSYIIAIMVVSLTISLFCIMEQRKKLKSDE